MADNNLEITYIPYGLDEISLLDLMTNLANGVEGYLGSKRWARKDKYRNAWLAAYLDIIGRGLTGASNDSGVWTVNHNGEAIPFDTKSEIEKEMYQDAAYYIQLQMAKMTPRKKEEEKKKEDLTPFKFKESFTQLLLNNRFGGDSSLFSDTEQGWNTLDARGANGLRGTEKRREAMAAELESYLKTIEDGKFNFEGTSFKDENDARTKILTAINALRDTPNDESDDIPAFSALGLNYRGFFSNGGNEASTHINPATNTPFTYNEWNLYQLQLAEAKTKLEAEKAKAQQANYWKGFKSPDFSKFNGRPLKTEESNIDYLTLLFSKGNWNGDEASQIVTAFKLAEKNGQLVPLSKEELSKLNPNIWGNRSKYLRKINGINSPLYYDTLNKLFKYFYNLTSPQTSFLDILNLNSPEVTAKKQLEVQKKYLSNTEWTADLTRELAGIVADVASVIDPEPISAGGLALTGTGLRAYNRWNDADGFTWTDAGHTALDAGLSLFGMIPVVGDAALAARVIGKLQKAAGWLGAAFAATSVPLAAKAAWNKVVNGKDMTVDDWRAIGNVLMGATQARRIQLNRAAGNVVKNLGGGTKAEKVAEVEVKIGDKTEKVLISLQEAELLKLAYKKAGNNLEETSKALKNSRAVRRELEAKKTSDGKPAYTKEQLDAIEAPQAASGFVRGKLPVGRDTRGIKSTTRTILTEGTTINETSPLRVLFMNKNKGFWGRGNYGWNINGGGNNSNRFKSWWERFKNPYGLSEIKPIESSRSNSQLSTLKQSTQLLTMPPTQISHSKNEIRKDWKNTIERKLFTLNELKAGEYNITNPKDSKYNVNVKVSEKDSEGFRTLIINGSNPVKIKTLKELLERIAKAMQSYRNTVNNSTAKAGINHKEVGKILRDLKAKGWLKQGGQINPSLDTIIEDFIKNNNI